MKIVYSDDHLGHAGFKELRGEDWVGMADNPTRAQIILAALADRGLTDVIAPKHHGPEAILRVHDAVFVHFLEHGYTMWQARYGSGSAAFARMFGMRGLAQTPDPANIDAMLSAYTFDIFSPLVAGSWTSQPSRPKRRDGTHHAPSITGGGGPMKWSSARVSVTSASVASSAMM